jgi:superfamily II DNA or RNA helicase
MSLREIAFQEDYATGENDLLDDFFRPSLRNAHEYWRGVGYFSSSALEAFGAPLRTFIENGGTIKLVASVELHEKDVEAIKDGLSKQEVCERRLDEIIEEEFIDGAGNGVSRLVGLLEGGLLEIKIATPKGGRGIYHEKVGVFFDEADFVAFSGSTNESKTAFEDSRECVDVFSSWESPKRAERKKTRFLKLWEDKDEGADVYDFPDAVAKKLIRICKHEPGTAKNDERETKRWRHQEEALELFLHKERGVLEMATGTGKTRIALKILKSLFDQDKIDTVIISTDGNDLLDQWYGEIPKTLNEIERELHIYRHFKSRNEQRRETQEFNLNPNAAVLITARGPLAGALRNLTRKMGERTLLIHDEVHGLGSPGNRSQLEGLTDEVRFRLGLSATPEREYDQEGNNFIEKHIGPVIMTFGLREAIERGILAPFNYHPLDYQITDEDRGRIKKVYAARAARKAANQPMSDAEFWTKLAEVYKTSKAKLPIFREFISQQKQLLERCIIFVETQDYGNDVLDIIHEHRPDFHTYFSGEDSETLKRFAYGDLECLLTCHRLSEGIDIQSLSSVVLFSSSRARLETIQRMGRCLRTDPNDPEKFANIVDFIRKNPDADDLNTDEMRCDWLVELSMIRCEEDDDGT